MLPLALLFALLMAIPPASAGRTAETAITHNCQDFKVKPSRILFACGDGNYYATSLRWSSWATRKAQGRGVFHFNDCDPDCAGGTFHRRAGDIVVKKLLLCSEDDGIYVFKRAHITYDEPYTDVRTVSLKLFCPLHF
jgi:hypothetical protein